MGISKSEVKKIEKRISGITDNSLKKNLMKRKSVTIDENTILKVKNFGEEKVLDFSSALRFIINDYFSLK